MSIPQLRKVIDCCIPPDVHDDYGFEACCKEMTDILSEDVSASIHFFLRQCTNEEFTGSDQYSPMFLGKSKVPTLWTPCALG